MSLQLILLSVAVAATSTSSVSTSTQGGSLFSDEEIPDEGGGGLFSDEEIPDESSSGGLFSDEEIPSDDDADGDGLFSGEVESLFTPTARTSIALEFSAAIDTSFDLEGENIIELSIFGEASLDVDFAKNWSAYVKPMFRQVTAINREGDDREIVYLNIPEAHVTYRSGRSSVRVGTQIFNWGTSDFSAPADILNPSDLRVGFVGSTPEQAKIPVLAVEGVTGIGPVTLRGVFQPFFTASRFYLTGWDDSLLRISGQAGGLNLPDINGLLGPPTVDRIGDLIVVSDRPADRPDNGTFGARATANFDDVDVSATAIYGWETFPQIQLDPNVATLAGFVLGSLGNNQPISFATLPPEILSSIDGINQAVSDGRTLFEGTYRRRALIGADAAVALDPFVLKFDVAYTFARTLYTQGDFRPVRRPWLNAVVGAEYFWGDELQILVEVFTLGVFSVRSNERLQLFERTQPAPMALDIDSERRSVFLPGIIGVVRYSVLDGDLLFEVAAVSTLERGDFILLPNITYRIDDNQQLTFNGLLLEGRSDGYGGLYSHNDRIQFAYRWSM